jgi:CRISPR/Cas system-associated exonuclease Cas4 (RecB family)
MGGGEVRHGIRIGDDVFSRSLLQELAQEMVLIEDWPLPVLWALASFREGDWRELHPSELGRCLRARALSFSTPFVQRPDPAWAPLIGRAIHEYLAQAAKDLFRPEEVRIEERLEFRFSVEGEELVLSGQIDLYHRPSRTILDYKTTGSLNPKKGLPWEYELQQNLYAEILRQNGESPERSLLWLVETRLRRPKGKGAELRFQALEVPLWAPEEVQEVLKELGRVVVRAHRDGVLPPPFRPEEEGYWQCGFCALSEVCRSRAEKGE